MIKEAIAQLVKRNDLTAETMGEVMEEIMTNQATDAQKASFLTALAMKGETIDEITAAAKVMRAHCERFLNDMDVLEIVGTGGDGSNTFNISTLSSFVASAAGIHAFCRRCQKGNGNPYLIQCVRTTCKPGWRNHAVIGGIQR